MKLTLKTKVELIVTGCLLVIFLIVVATSMFPLARRPVTFTRAPAAALILEGGEYAGQRGCQLSVLKDRVRKLRWDRDPFELVEAEKAAALRFTFSGVLSDGVETKAVINDDIVGIGEQVGGYTIVSIDREKVVLTDGRKEFELRLWQEQ